MALSEANKLLVKELFSIPSNSTIFDSRFAALTEAEEARITAILTEYSAVALQDTSLNVEGYKRSDMRTELKLKTRLAPYLGISMNNSTVRLS